MHRECLKVESWAHKHVTCALGPSQVLKGGGGARGGRGEGGSSLAATRSEHKPVWADSFAAECVHYSERAEQVRAGDNTHTHTQLSHSSA